MRLRGTKQQQQRYIDTSLALRHARFVNKLPYTATAAAAVKWMRMKEKNATKPNQPTLQQQIQWQLICDEIVDIFCCSPVLCCVYVCITASMS